MNLSPWELFAGAFVAIGLLIVTSIVILTIDFKKEFKFSLFAAIYVVYVMLFVIASFATPKENNIWQHLSDWLSK